jgi:alpha-beta hydrolase superfamily lysophospholipase
VAEPRLEVRPAPGTTRAVALFCHGGAAAGLEPPRERALSLVRMRAVEQFVSGAAAGRGLTTCVLRYRLAGWNGDAADAFADARWALGRIAAEHGDVPVVLVGHSMGGRAVLRAGGAPQVTAVCALAPWTPPEDPVEQLRGRTVAILHGRGDRWVPAELSAHFAVRARRAGVPVARFTIAGGHTMVRRAPAWHAFARDVVLAGAGFAPLRADLAAALQAGGTRGLAVPLAA